MKIRGDASQLSNDLNKHLSGVTVSLSQLAHGVESAVGNLTAMVGIGVGIHEIEGTLERGAEAAEQFEHAIMKLNAVMEVNADRR